MAAGERLTIAKFTSQYRKNFPAKFIGPNEDLKFSKGDRFRAHSVKQSTLEYDNGLRENISTESSIPFAILFDLHNNTKAATNGYKFIGSRSATLFCGPEGHITAQAQSLLFRLTSSWLCEE